MGQEIVHCSVCGVRLRSSDFERGEALRIDRTAYCKKCSEQIILPEPLPTSTTTNKRKTSTARIPIVTPRRAMEPVAGADSFPPALLWGGGALLIALIAAIALATGRRSPAPAPPRASTPEIVERKAPTPVPVEKSPRVEPARNPVPAVDPRAALAEIDRKVAAAAAQEKFRVGFDLLTAAKDRVDTLEWTAEIQKRTRDLDATVKALYLGLQEKLDDARKRGADAEAASILDRIAKWDLPGYRPAAAPPPVAEAPPPPPPVESPAPVTATAPPPPAIPAPAAPAPVALKEGMIPFVAGALNWTLLAPKRMSATEGVTLTPLEDGSILAGGPVPARSKYAIVVQTELKGISGFRVEALPDKSLHGSGPGRAFNGNLVLTEFQVQVLSDPSANSGVSVALEKLAASDYAQDGFPAKDAVDGNKETGWALGSSFGRAHEALFDTRNPISSSGPLTLLIILDHQSIHEHHQLGRFRLSATTSKGAAYDRATRVPVIDASRVEQAIQRGIAYLRRGTYPADYKEWSPNELILWTYVHAGVPETDAEFQRRLKQMLDGPLEKTYRVALQAMILEELDRVAYQLRLWQCAQFLIDNQCPNGQWPYGTPTEFPKGVPSSANPPVPTTAKLDPDGRRIKPKVARKLVARKTRDGPAEGDNSNAQYAALGLRACFDAGIAIPEDTIVRAIRWWVGCQFPDDKSGEYAAKGWSYIGPSKDKGAYNAMTVGGISSLTIYDYMLGRDWRKNAAIKPAINWTAQHWSLGTNYYYLYGLERAGVLYGAEKFGRYAWYPLGAEFILDQQDASGAWRTPPWWEKMDEEIFNTWNTCFAILFLRHATRPLVASEDRR